MAALPPFPDPRAGPFVLLDDARPGQPSPARLYRAPQSVVVARRPDELPAALARLDRLHDAGLHLAGTFAYEAGLALEPRLAARAAPRSGAAGPLLWFGAFTGYAEIAPEAMGDWLAQGTAGRAATVGPLDPALAAGAYLSAFTTMREAITAGDIYQGNLTFPLVGAYQGDPLALYARLRPAGGAGYGGVVFDGSHWLLSLSPELFFALRGQAATVKPMKGTRPRHADPAADAAAAADLAASAKDRAENLMIVDLMRNDVSRVAEPGSVRVEAPFAIESYPTVHQMVTTVRARLSPGQGALGLVRALLPCGSITGAPKIRAMELIDAVEPAARGPYCGAIGRIDPPDPDGSGTEGYGDSAFNVAIRTLRLAPDETGRGRAVLGVGSAVVADSDGLTEWRECLVKGGFVRASAGGFDLIETMAFDPESGIALLEQHLERVGRSAAELGRGFDRHAIRNAIQALCFEQDGPARVRLVISRSGAYALEIGALPAALPTPARCAVLPLPVDPGDWRLRHKTSDRGFYAAALRAAHGAGADEALLLHPDGVLTEGSFTNLFVARDGVLLTPPAARGLLPGVLRGALLADGRAREADLTLDDLADGFLLGNAVRGLVPAQLIG
ncbi:aminodeoxychorismate synthase component I [Novosphingobium piscinae]|uniref:Probable branched-chain-amino-acid aminotransferase n=1 Tax=Novosphingobium piscinae TaxID=1507448 RepID=A0A7X1G0J0_9SPHN|nr:aminodeoxychorismate synthase component I [Novosphingobium piscinae]MBC2670269.1 aminodeoxychorismate synthase component I [Novosphingobium piscinae]